LHRDARDRQDAGKRRNTPKSYCALRAAGRQRCNPRGAVAL